MRRQVAISPDQGVVVNCVDDRDQDGPPVMLLVHRRAYATYVLMDVDDARAVISALTEAVDAACGGGAL